MIKIQNFKFEFHLDWNFQILQRSQFICNRPANATIVLNSDIFWPILTFSDQFWHFLTNSDKFWHLMSLRSDVLWHFVMVNGFKPLIIVTFYQILSQFITYCHGLTHVIRLCHKLSQAVRIDSHFTRFSIFLLKEL